MCPTHGGSAPQVKAAAEQRESEAAADASIRKLWVGLDQATAVKDPVASLEKLAGALEHLLGEVGEQVNELQHVAAGQHLSQLHGKVVLWERTATLLAKVLDAMARLGIAERQVRLEEGQAAIITTAFRAALALLDERVQLLPADRDLVVRTFLEGLGQHTVAGEVA